MIFGHDIHPLAQALAGILGGAAGTFVLLVLIDDVLGIACGIRDHTFDAHKLPSFLRSQYGTRELAILLGIVATAGVSAFTALYAPGATVKNLAAAVAAASLAAAVKGAASLTLAVVADIVAKAGHLTAARPEPAKG